MIETRNLNNEKVTIEELYYKKGKQEERERILKIIDRFQKLRLYRSKSCQLVFKRILQEINKEETGK